jgi:hypothetical protein
MTKTLNQIIFFAPPKSEYFFRKNHTTPFKLNGRSLTENQMKANPDKLQAIAIGKKTENENISFNRKKNNLIQSFCHVTYC